MCGNENIENETVNRKGDDVKVLWVSFFVVLADQITKVLVKGCSIPFLGLHVEGMPIGYSRPVLGDFLRLTYVENPGMAFGVDLGGKLYLTLFSILASIGIFFYIYYTRKETLLFRSSLALILGGALGNLVDRVLYGVLYGEAPLFYGKVVDFVDFEFFNINLFGYQLTRFWVFNIADSAVTIGVVILILFHRSFIKEEDAVSLSVEHKENG